MKEHSVKSDKRCDKCKSSLEYKYNIFNFHFGKVLGCVNSECEDWFKRLPKIKSRVPMPSVKPLKYLLTLRKEYNTQNNIWTASPIYVTVQELICIGVMKEDYSPSGPFGDSETKEEFREDNEDNEDNEEPLNMGYIWTPVEFFLTVKGAEDYIKNNSYNHGKLRTYVHHFNDKNIEMYKFLESINFKTK